jgi:hypothetical protein
VAFIRSWMSEALQATLAGLAIPFALLGLLAAFALGGGLGGLNSLGQLVGGPAVSSLTPPTPASGRVHETRAVAVDVLPTIPKLGGAHTQRVTVGHRAPATRAPVGRMRHYRRTAPQAPQTSGTGSHPGRPPGGGPAPPPPCACGPPPPSQPLLPDPGTTVAGIQGQLSAAPSAAHLALPDVIGSVTQLSGGTASAPKS